MKLEGIKEPISHTHTHTRAVTHAGRTPCGHLRCSLDVLQQTSLLLSRQPLDASQLLGSDLTGISSSVGAKVTPRGCVRCLCV